MYFVTQFHINSKNEMCKCLIVLWNFCNTDFKLCYFVNHQPLWQDIGDGWWEARNASGEQGLIPESYVEVSCACSPVLSRDLYVCFKTTSSYMSFSWRRRRKEKKIIRDHPWSLKWILAQYLTCKSDMPQRDHLSKASISFEKRQEVRSNWHVCCGNCALWM